MYRDVEEQLKQNFNSLNPDLFSAIKDKSIPKIESEEELFSEMPCSHTHSFSRRRHFATYISAAVFLCIITTFLYMNRSTAVGMIVVEASSSVTLSVDQYNKIIDVVSDNSEDVKNYSVYKGKDLSNGLENIFSDIKQKSSETVTNIKVTYRTIKTCEKTKKKLKETVDDYSKKDGVYVEADYQSTGSSEYVEAEETTEAAPEDITKEETMEQEMGDTQASATITEETESSLGDSSIEDSSMENPSTDNSSTDNSSTEDSSVENPSNDNQDSTSETEIVEEQPKDSETSSSIDNTLEESHGQDNENDQTMDKRNPSPDDTNNAITSEDTKAAQSDVGIHNEENIVKVEKIK